MEDELRGGAAPYDYGKNERIWQRVAPSLSPYSGGEERTAEQALLPGDLGDPCCMATAARDSLAVIGGFMEAEEMARQQLLAIARQEPAAFRAPLREAARREEEQLRRLAAVYYLITGRRACPALPTVILPAEGLCPMLRRAYHDAACQGMHYLRAAEGTADPCLQKVFRELAAEQERQSRLMESLLERALTGSCGWGGMGV